MLLPRGRRCQRTKATFSAWAFPAQRCVARVSDDSKLPNGIATTDPERRARFTIVEHTALKPVRPFRALRTPRKVRGDSSARLDLNSRDLAAHRSIKIPLDSSGAEGIEGIASSRQLECLRSS